jgi:RimJ/RimL family protein N-acetyltransferase
MEFLNRELRAEDIPLITGYWDSITPSDIQRMYIDVSKLPSKEEQAERLKTLLDTPPAERSADPLIWEVDEKAVGMTNLNNIVRGEEANIHLHVFDPQSRGKGIGRRLFIISVHKYLQRHQLKKVICEPAATNPDPNRLMQTLGIPVVRKYLNKTPSVICFEHEVNRYEIDWAFFSE